MDVSVTACCYVMWLWGALMRRFAHGSTHRSKGSRVGVLMRCQQFYIPKGCLACFFSLSFFSQRCFPPHDAVPLNRLLEYMTLPVTGRKLGQPLVGVLAPLGISASLGRPNTSSSFKHPDDPHTHTQGDLFDQCIRNPPPIQTIYNAAEHILPHTQTHTLPRRLLVYDLTAPHVKHDYNMLLSFSNTQRSPTPQIHN